jgi:hypothetical protein
VSFAQNHSTALHFYWHFFHVALLFRFRSYFKKSPTEAIELSRSTLLYRTTRPPIEIDVAQTIAEAKEASRGTLGGNISWVNSSSIFSDIDRLIQVLRHPVYAEWPKQKDSAEKIARYFDRIANDDNTRVRFVGEWGTMLLLRDDQTGYFKSRKHCEALLDLYKKENLFVQEKNMRVDIIHMIQNSRFSGNDVENESLKATYLGDILEYAFQKRLISTPSYLDDMLVNSFEFIVKNNKAEAASLLQRADKEFENQDTPGIIKRMKDRLSVFPKSAAPISVASKRAERKSTSYNSVRLYSSSQSATTRIAGGLMKDPRGILSGATPSALGPTRFIICHW